MARLALLRNAFPDLRFVRVENGKYVQCFFKFTASVHQVVELVSKQELGILSERRMCTLKIRKTYDFENAGIPLESQKNKVITRPMNGFKRQISSRKPQSPR